MSTPSDLAAACFRGQRLHSGRALTGVVGGVGAVGPPDGRVGGVRAVLVQRTPTSLVLLADLRQVVHAKAAQLLRNGSLTLSPTHS